MSNFLKSIVGDEAMKFIAELFDPNAGNIYYPQGIDPKVVRLFEKLHIKQIDEDYEGVSEIKNLATDIIKKIANENYPMIIKSGVFNYLYGVHLGNINHSKYKRLNDFIENSNIQIYILPQKGTVKGAYSTITGQEFDPKHEREIELFVNYRELKENIDEKIKEGRFSERELFSTIYNRLFSSLVHELQHAYDDYRSKGKIYQKKEWLKYKEKYLKDKIRDNQYDDFKKAVDYLNLPHEIWARFSQAIQKVFFYTFDVEGNDLVYEMHPLKEVVKNFIRNFKGFNVLPDKMKRKLINKIVQFWHYEKEKVDKHNKGEESLNEDVIGQATNDMWKPTTLYKNPKSIKRFEPWVKAIVDEEGNLFIEDNREDWLHKQMAERLKQLDAINYQGDFYDNIGKFITLYRVGNTDMFGLSDSARLGVDAAEIIEKANKMNPQYKIFMKYYDQLEKEQ